MTYNLYRLLPYKFFPILAWVTEAGGLSVAQLSILTEMLRNHNFASNIELKMLNLKN
jgi:hypothetical protein